MASLSSASGPVDVFDVQLILQHKGINEFYDIPSVSLRNPFLPQVVGNFKEVEKFFNRNSGQKGQAEGMDLRHVS